MGKGCVETVEPVPSPSNIRLRATSWTYHEEDDPLEKGLSDPLVSCLQNPVQEGVLEGLYALLSLPLDIIVAPDLSRVTTHVRTRTHPHSFIPPLSRLFKRIHTFLVLTLHDNGFCITRGSDQFTKGLLKKYSIAQESEKNLPH